MDALTEEARSSEGRVSSKGIPNVDPSHAGEKEGRTHSSLVKSLSDETTNSEGTEGGDKSRSKRETEDSSAYTTYLRKSNTKVTAIPHVAADESVAAESLALVED